MNKQTPSKLDQELEETQALLAMRRLAPYLQAEKKVMKDTKLAKRLFEKTQKPRIRKPKPKRRPKQRVTVISIGGQSIEDENGDKTEN